MKISEIRDLTPEELRHEYDEAARELFNLRVQKASDQLEKPSMLKELRRTVARMKTVQREHEREAENR